METIEPPRPADSDAPLVYALDRRGPNDPRVGSIHFVLGTLVVAFVAACLVVL